MGFEPNQFVEEDADQREDRLRADAFAEKMNAINERLKATIAYAQATQERYVNQSRTDAPVYRVNNYIWLDIRNLQTHRPSKKLDCKNDGPFKILERIDTYAYRLELPNDWDHHDVFHTILLRRARDDPLSDQIALLPYPMIEEDDAESWPIESILDSRFKKNKLEYLVKWQI